MTTETILACILGLVLGLAVMAFMKRSLPGNIVQTGGSIRQDQHVRIETLTVNLALQVRQPVLRQDGAKALDDLNQITGRS